ncbi:Aquaporin-1 [Colletotrichum siamense]|uniref:MIP family channel protein n=1 Tax=Colletotrichum gloeosporioides (strain Cg-14) TaxID=1237896 RepID=T0KC04_COLGC|nr:MIP family channel protein [Colletotrichum gloeosporioides Cg-14]KAF4822529.1 Aquaporin-1 [Colletotrichum siamense]
MTAPTSHNPVKQAVDAVHATQVTPAKRGYPYNLPSRNLIVVVLGEFCGTFMFLLLSFIGAQTALVTNSPDDSSAPLSPASLMYIASSFGTAIAVNVWIFYRVSGGMFNPAVTLGLLLVGAVKPLAGLCIIPAQLAASIAASAVVYGVLPGPLLVNNTLGNGATVAQGFFIEMLLTAQLVLTVYFLAVEKHRATFLAPIGVGISVFIAHITATNWTGTSINPARSFGPAVIAGFVNYHWIYWIGPFAGAILSFLVYAMFKWLEYQTANPGQDDDMEKAQKPVDERPPLVPRDSGFEVASPLEGGHGRP